MILAKQPFNAGAESVGDSVLFVGVIVKIIAQLGIFWCPWADPKQMLYTKWLEMQYQRQVRMRNTLKWF